MPNALWRETKRERKGDATLDTSINAAVGPLTLKTLTSIKLRELIQRYMEEQDSSPV